MFIRIKNFVLDHPYIFMFIWVLAFISILLFFNIEIFYSGDLYMYIHLAQSIIDGGVVYKDAIDTKNIAFILFFSGFYFIYTKFFATMVYFFIYQAVFLTLWYFALSVLSYKIVTFISNKSFGILSSILLISTLAMIPQSFFMNQPQITLLFYFVYIYVVLKTWKNHRTIHYALYGFLLAVCFLFNSPYIFLTLSIPCLILIEDKKSITLKNINYSKFFLRSSVAFLGFLIGLLPIFIYLYQKNAVSDWLFWNFTYATGSYSEGYFGGLKNPFIKPILGIISITFKFVILSIYTLDSIFHAIFVDVFLVLWGFIVYYKIFRKKTMFSSEYENILFILVFFTSLARVSLIRPYMSYNIYLFPLVFLTIPTTLTFAKTHFSKNIQHIAMSIFVMGMVYILGSHAYKITTAPKFNDTLATITDQTYSFQHAFKCYFPRYNRYSKEIAYISQQNSHKNPTVIPYSGWGPILYNYNTNWKNIYYNVYLEDHQFIEKVKELNPEVIFIAQRYIKNLYQNPGYNEFLQTHYKPVIPNYDFNRIFNSNEFLSTLYEKEIDMMFIRIQDYDKWDLKIPDNIDSYPNPVKTLKDVFFDIISPKSSENK